MVSLLGFSDSWLIFQQICFQKTICFKSFYMNLQSDFEFFTPGSQIEIYNNVILLHNINFTSFSTKPCVQQILKVRLLNSKDQAYKEHRFNFIKKQLPYCHPRWTEEQEFLEKEIERIQDYKSTFWQDYWNIFEWASLFFVLLMFTLHIINIISPDRDVYKAANFISALSLLLIWFRLYKTLRIARMFSELNVLLSEGDIFFGRNFCIIYIFFLFF